MLGARRSDERLSPPSEEEDDDEAREEGEDGDCLGGGGGIGRTPPLTLARPSPTSERHLGNSWGERDEMR